MIKVSIMWSHC